MINVKSKRCIYEGCMKQPTFNLSTETKSLYCAEHKLKNMINVKDKLCTHEGCMKIPLFNLPTETKGLYCFDHKLVNMINVKDKRCIHEGCMKITPVFNLPTETKGLYCSDHRLENMINVRSNRCMHDGCTTRPNYNLPTETKALYCAEHKLENMINIKSKRCIYENCNKQPTFNLPTETKALYCSEHKLENMIDIKNKHCIYENCNTIPNFNLPTETKALYCAEHKLENMINVKDKRCQTKNCKQTAIFGYRFKRTQYCEEHKQPEMINLVLENKCSVLDCNNEYEYIITNNKYCIKHTPDNYETSLKRLCKWCDFKETTYICKDCTKRMAKKEWAVVRHLRRTINTKFEYNSSKMLQGCSKRRPDIYFELLRHCVIVEIDEHQHNTYEGSCECARINEIVNGIGGKSVVIIRFNPDTTKHKGKRLPNKLSDKVELLVETVKEELIREYDVFQIKLIQLYYDDNYEIYNEKKEELITNIVCI